MLESHLQAGVEAPSLLFLLCRCGIEPHKAIIPQDNGRTTWQIVEMCFLPLDQGWRELHEDALSQLTARKRKHEAQREGKTSDTLTFSSSYMCDLPFHTLNCECGETVLHQQRWIAPQPAKLGKRAFKKGKGKKGGEARENLYFHYTDEIAFLKVFSHGKLILSRSSPLKDNIRVGFR